MKSLFDIVGWLAMFILLLTSIPQIILNFQRKSAEGVSWLTFAMLLFGMFVLFLRSLSTTSDLIIKLNYGLGTFIVFLVNLQIFYYRILKPKPIVSTDK